MLTGPPPKFHGTRDILGKHGLAGKAHRSCNKTDARDRLPQLARVQRDFMSHPAQ